MLRVRVMRLAAQGSERMLATAGGAVSGIHDDKRNGVSAAAHQDCANLGIQTGTVPQLCTGERDTGTGHTTLRGDAGYGISRSGSRDRRSDLRCLTWTASFSNWRHESASLACSLRLGCSCGQMTQDPLRRMEGGERAGSAPRPPSVGTTSRAWKTARRPGRSAAAVRRCPCCSGGCPPG